MRCIILLSTASPEQRVCALWGALLRVDAVGAPEVRDDAVSAGGGEGEADVQTRSGYHLVEGVQTTALCITRDY